MEKPILPFLFKQLHADCVPVATLERATDNTLYDLKIHPKQYIFKFDKATGEMKEAYVYLKTNPQGEDLYIRSKADIITYFNP